MRLPARLRRTPRWLLSGAAGTLLTASFGPGCSHPTPSPEIASGEQGSASASPRGASPRPARRPAVDSVSPRYEANDAPTDSAYAEGESPVGRAAKSSAPPPAWRRPGLATQWGEARDSHVRETSFQRQRPLDPAATLRVQYDDEAGVHATTGRYEEDAYPAVFPLHGGDFTLRVEDDDGDPLAAIRAGGRTYVIGDSGDRYQLTLQNHTPGRFEIVTTVDGLDVLDGAEGSLDKRGYLVQPWASLTIDGFRESYDTVRAFRFGSVAESYAARRGKALNIGVLGVAIYEERGFDWYGDPGERWRRDHADPFPGRFAPPPS